ncbi:hypothetical protein [Novosphingobium aureum]|nr:hypothetical protein [Novosphingobium aureum]
MGMQATITAGTAAVASGTTPRADARSTATRGGMRAGAVLAGSVSLLALPSAVMAFSATFGSGDGGTGLLERIDSSSSEGLSRAVALRSLAGSRAFPFTPAGTPNRPERSVTVAVRVDGEATQSIIVRGQHVPAKVDKNADHVRIASTAFNLGVSRGYQNFAQDIAQQTERRRSIAEMPDLQKFSLAPATQAREHDSRFSTRLSIDEKRAPGRAPRTFVTDAGEVDLSGAYRLTENLDVTAGLRYSQDRERLRPLTDGRQDSQAVYVGTQFRF